MKRTITIEYDDGGTYGVRPSSVAEELIDVIRGNRYLMSTVDAIRYTDDGQKVRSTLLYPEVGRNA